MIKKVIIINGSFLTKFVHLNIKATSLFFQCSTEKKVHIFVWTNVASKTADRWKLNLCKVAMYLYLTLLLLSSSHQSSQSTTNSALEPDRVVLCDRVFNPVWPAMWCRVVKFALSVWVSHCGGVIGSWSKTVVKWTDANWSDRSQ